MIRIQQGRIIRTDTGYEKWGIVLYMVINPPIICETCGSVIFQWRQIDGVLICPDCENVVTKRDYFPCPFCGQNDYHTLRVVHNNNWHYDSITGQVTQYCDKKGQVLNLCGKSLMEQIKNQSIVLMTAKESQDMKRKILWTRSDDYDPVKPMPQWVIDAFPYDKQR